SPSQRRLHRLGTHVVMPYTTHAAYSCSASAPYVITFTPSFLTYCTTSLCFTTTQQSHTHTHTQPHFIECAETHRTEYACKHSNPHVHVQTHMPACTHAHTHHHHHHPPLGLAYP